MFGDIVSVLDWFIANAGMEAAFAVACAAAVFMGALLVACRRRSAGEREWFRTQFDEAKREVEAARSQKSSAEGDAERWAALNDKLRTDNDALRRRNADLRDGLIVPDGADRPVDRRRNPHRLGDE